MTQLRPYTAICQTGFLILFLCACGPVVETNKSQNDAAPQEALQPVANQQTFSPQKSIPEWDMYIDSNSYAIQYPPAWNLKVGEGNDTEMLRIESPDGKNVLIIQGLASFSSKPLQSMCDGLITTLEVEVLEQTTDTLGGKSACRVHYAFRTNDNRQIKETLYLTENGLGMLFYYYTLSGRSPDLERIVHSIQFKSN
jgi:hypothetical protein